MQKREDEREARRNARKHEHQESRYHALSGLFFAPILSHFNYSHITSLSHIYSKRDIAWNQHVEDRAKFRERQATRLIEGRFPEPQLNEFNSILYILLLCHQVFVCSFFSFILLIAIEKKEIDHELEEIKARQEALRERQAIRSARGKFYSEYEYFCLFFM